MSKQSEKKESDKTVVHVQVSKVEKAQIAKHAEALGVSSAELFRRGAQLAAFSDPSLWEMLMFLSERSGVSLWHILFLSLADQYSQFAAEDMNFLKTRTLERFQSLDRIYCKDPGELVKRLTMERSIEFNKTRSGEREDI